VFESKTNFLPSIFTEVQEFNKEPDSDADTGNENNADDNRTWFIIKVAAHSVTTTTSMMINVSPPVIDNTRTS
jgi:hypothetical protein